jgi:hypothetical protein
MDGFQQGLPPDSIEVSIDEAKENWSEYKLSDGTLLRARPVITSVFHVKGQYSPDGEPIYLVRSQLVIAVRAKESKKATRS